MKYWLLAFALCAIQKGMAQKEYLVTYGIPDSVSFKPDPAFARYGSPVDFPPFVCWEKNGKTLWLNGGQTVYTMRKPQGNIRIKHTLRQGLEPDLSPDRRSFFMLEDEDGDENYRLFVYHIPNGKTDTLTEKGARVSDPVWSPDGKRILYKSNRRKVSETDLYLRNASAPYNERLVWQNVGDESRVHDWEPTSDAVLFTKVISETDKPLFLLDLASGRAQPLGDQKEVAHAGARFLPGRNGYLLVSDEDSEFRQLRFYDAREKKSRSLTGDLGANVTEWDMDSAGKRFVFTLDRDGKSELYRMELSDFSFRRIDSVPPGLIRDLKLNAAGSRLAFNLYGDTFYKKVYAYDLHRGRWERLMQRGKKDPAGSTFTAAIPFRYPVRDSVSDMEQQVPAFIYKPQTPGKHPVYVDIHGGPEYGVQPRFSRWYQYLVNELGVAVILPNVRGSDGYGKTWLKADDGLNRENALADIGGLLDWVTTQPDLDQNRVALFGESYGGYMVLAALARYPQKIACGIDVVGIADWVTYLEHTGPYRQDLRRVEFGDERDPGMRRFLTEISPANRAERIESPVFIVQGYNDPRVHYRESEKMSDVLKKQGKEVWFLMARNEGHGFRTSQNRTYQKNAEIAFLKRFLLLKR